MCMPSLVSLALLQAESERPRQVCIPIPFGSLGRRSFERCAGPRQDTMKRTTARHSPILRVCACQVWWLWNACRPTQIDHGNCWSKCAYRFTLPQLAHSAHPLWGRSFYRQASQRMDTAKRITVQPSPILWPCACHFEPG